MAIVTINKCLICGETFNAIDAPHASACGPCGRARRLREQFGTGEMADMLFALYHPADYEREQRNHERFRHMFPGLFKGTT